jgi:hypothetical protein
MLKEAFAAMAHAKFARVLKLPGNPVQAPCARVCREPRKKSQAPPQRAPHSSQHALARSCRMASPGRSLMIPAGAGTSFYTHALMLFFLFTSPDCTTKARPHVHAQQSRQDRVCHSVLYHGYRRH